MLTWDMFRHPVRDELMDFFGIPAVKQFLAEIFITEHLCQFAQYQQMLVCRFSGTSKIQAILTGRPSGASKGMASFILTSAAAASRNP